MKLKQKEILTDFNNEKRIYELNANSKVSASFELEGM